jgi:AcrR family transcriptional regulator
MTAPARLSRDERKAETRARLLEAAATVFARRGYERASVEEIAETAGFTKGAVYAHFASKDELFLAMVDERFQRRAEAICRAWADDRNPLEQARDSAAEFMSFVDSDPDWGLLFFETWVHAVRNPELGRELVKRYATLRKVVAEVVESRARAAGIELPIPADRVAFMVFSMGMGVALERVLEPEQADPDLYPALLEIFTRGLKAMARPRRRGPTGAGAR